MSGVKKLTLHDKSSTRYEDLNGQFFLSQKDVGKNRAQCCINKLQELNFYVRLDLLGIPDTNTISEDKKPATKYWDQELPTDKETLDKLNIKDYDVIIICNSTNATIMALSKYCRDNKVKLIVTDNKGIFSRIFCDFGTEFICYDKNGEEAQEVMLEDISIDEKGIVKCLQNVKHNLEDGDYVQINKVEGMEILKQDDKDQDLPKKEDTQEEPKKEDKQEEVFYIILKFLENGRKG